MTQRLRTSIKILGLSFMAISTTTIWLFSKKMDVLRDKRLSEEIAGKSLGASVGNIVDTIVESKM